MTELSDRALVAELLRCARELVATNDRSLTSLMVGREYGLAEAMRATSAFERARNRWGVGIEEGLRRSGLYAETLAGTFPLPDSILAFLNRFVGRERSSFGAFELYGAVSSGGPVELGGGFQLRRFSRDEVAKWNPPARREQLDPYVVAEYSFVVSESARTFPPERPFQLRPAKPIVERDPFWAEGWWKPFLVLNLFSSTPVIAGVRLQVTPGWRIEQEGEFEGESLPSLDPQTGENCGDEYWHRFATHHEFEGERAGRVSAFSILAMEAISVLEVGDEAVPFRVASRSYLRAMRMLPKLKAPRVVDFGELEDCLFDLVRAADGLCCRIDLKDRRLGDRPGFGFEKRVGALAGVKARRFLSRCAKLRAGLAHSFGEGAISPQDVHLLAKIVRLAFLKYLSAGNSLGWDRDALVERLVNAATMPMPSQLCDLALPF